MENGWKWAEHGLFPLEDTGSSKCFPPNPAVAVFGRSQSGLKSGISNCRSEVGLNGHLEGRNWSDKSGNPGISSDLNYPWGDPIFQHLGRPTCGTVLELDHLLLGYHGPCSHGVQQTICYYPYSSPTVLTMPFISTNILDTSSNCFPVCRCRASTQPSAEWCVPWTQRPEWETKMQNLR